MNARRKGQYLGMVVDDASDPLFGLRFADDVALIAQSRADIAKMLSHLKAEAANYGLRINAKKTKILTNTVATAPPSVQLGDAVVEILGRDMAEKYLGRQLRFEEANEAELSNRLQAAWRSFAKYTHIFRSKSYSFTAKMKLFEAVVTPTVLYGSGAWTLGEEC